LVSKGFLYGYPLRTISYSIQVLQIVNGMKL
jgi:hypothetical protein